LEQARFRSLTHSETRSNSVISFPSHLCFLCPSCASPANGHRFGLIWFVFVLLASWFRFDLCQTWSAKRRRQICLYFSLNFCQFWLRISCSHVRQMQINLWTLRARFAEHFTIAHYGARLDFCNWLHFWPLECQRGKLIKK